LGAGAFLTGVVSTAAVAKSVEPKSADASKIERNFIEIPLTFDLKHCSTKR
jgi:hypothetical protein